LSNQVLYLPLACIILLTPPSAFSADAEPPCLGCHDVVKTALQKRVVHAAVEMGCESCHLDHKKPDAGTAKQAPLLNAALPDLCGSCHELQDQKLGRAHRGQPIVKAVCTGCHDPHSSDEPKLMRANVHPAFSVESCDTCHRQPDGGEIRLTAASVSELCFQCHAQQKESLERSKFKHALLEADVNSCLTCHNPHAAAQPRLLKKSQPELCRDCHAVEADRRFVHEPAEVGCTICHSAHASDSPKNLHASVNAVCMECHSRGSAKVVSSDVPLHLFGNKVTLQANPFKKVQLLDLGPAATVGHPMAGHPFFVPSAGGKSELNCVSCHDPHAGNGSTKRFKTETAASTPLCVKCHA